MSFFRSFWKTGSKHKKLYDEWALSGPLEPENDEHAVETSFALKYLGSTLVENAASEVATAEAVKNILTLTKAAGRKISRVSVSISERGIRVSNPSSQDSILEVSIYRISYCSADATHSNVFAFIATNPNETLECHAFLCPKRKVAQTVSITVAQMFNSAFQDWQLSQEKLAFTQERAAVKNLPEVDNQKSLENLQRHCESSPLPLIDLNTSSPFQSTNWWHVYYSVDSLLSEVISSAMRYLKIGVTAIIGLVVVQYWLRGLPDMRNLEPFFAVNTSSSEAIPPWLQQGVADFTSNATDVVGLYIPDNSTQDTNITSHTMCPAVPPGLRGRIEAVKKSMTLSEVETSLPHLALGGSYRPTDCRSEDRVAIVVPYRDREQHLAVFLFNLHHMLVRQQIDYTIYIVEQEGNGPFNRGKLMNIGFVEANKEREYNCFIFHDVDLLPEDDRNLYTCPEQPRHMSVAIDKFKYKLPYKDLFGGVSALTKDQFQQVNGFSNLFWGWGGEDDDISYRIRHNGFHIARYPPYIARYAMLTHNKAAPNKDRFKVMQQGKKKHSTDGLNSLSYVRKKLEKFKLYTWIVADLQPPS